MIVNKFKVSSGDFEVIVSEENFLKAAVLAIKNQSSESYLGDLTMIQQVDGEKGFSLEPSFVCTRELISSDCDLIPSVIKFKV